MQTIADEAGVSRATVSLALQNSERLPLATRRRIQAIAQRLGYRPNPLVSTLMTYMRAARPPEYRETLAYIVSWPDGDSWRKMPYPSAVLEGVRERASQLGFAVDEFWVNQPGMSGARLSDILQARGIRGVIVAPMWRARGHLSLKWEHFACVAISYTLLAPNLHRVCCHYFHAITLALRQLRRHGYRRIGLALEMAFDQRADHGWLGGFAAYQQFRRPKDRVPMLMSPVWRESLFHEWFQKYQPDAVIGMNGQEIEWLAHLKKLIPRDVAYVALNAADAPPHVAAVDQQPRRSGIAAVEIVAALLQRNEYGVPEAAQVTLIEPIWREGDTIRKRQPLPAGARGRRELTAA